MNNEEKILEMLESLTGRVDQIQQEQKQVREDVSGMKGDISSLKGDISGMKEDISDLRATQEQMQTTLTRVALTQENIVLKSLDALAEGQSLTHQRLKDLAGKDDLAELREEVRLMRTVIAQHSRDIEELKAAK